MILQEVFDPVDNVKPLSKEQMKSMDVAREQDDFALPELQKPAPGFFDGMGTAAYRGVASSFLKTGSAFDTALSSTGVARSALQMAEVETGYPIGSIDSAHSSITRRLDEESRRLRQRARTQYGIDPTVMGTAAQLVYGVSEMIPKAIGYSLIVGPSGGSLLFGADYGINRAQELMDEGVDKDTAINAGIFSFATSALGMRLPATFGRSRIASAAIGAAANAGLSAAELQGVNWILEKQNYDELAKKYALNPVDIAVSGVFGGVMGGALWRRPATARAATDAAQDQPAPRRAALRDRIYNDLRQASPEGISDDQIRAQADLHAAGIQTMADRAQIDVYTIAPDIVQGEANGFSQRTVEFQPDEDLIQRAKDTFGVTNDIREAFYVLPDGTMLDGSGRHWGGDERDVAGQRQVDHGDIGEIIDDSTKPADAMYKWMARSGAMRFDQIVGIASIARKPTPQQLAVLSRASRGKYLALSLNTPEGRIVDDIEFERANPSKIRHFFEQAQVKADNGVAGAFAQENRGSFNPLLNRITLTANANISTYSHEMGHWYLTNIFELSKLDSAANSTLKEDAETLLKEFGVKSVADWNKLGVEGQRKFQEQFASWVEIYLAEGRAPKPTLQRLFERLGQWLVDLYRDLGGVKKAVGDTYKAEVGDELPPVSDEVAKVLDRLFAQDRQVRKASNVSKAQVAAARMVQADRTNENRLQEILTMPEGRDKAQALRDMQKSLQAQIKTIEAVRQGLPVDVSRDIEQMNIDTDHIANMKGTFGRTYVMGNNDSAVILQNRDRSDVSSQGQMNAIAANPQYGLVSVSRSYSGAPVVSYGTVPDDAHLGANDFIFETNGNRVPFIYAVVEADDVETSNLISGSTNENYGSPDRMNAVIGNGRMTALREAYRRGTADTYRQEMEADTAHGIDPEVIKQMKNPVLVRVMNPEDVTTGLISRSNSEQVLARDAVEVAFEDAPKIRARAGLYEFDDKGNPTQETTRMFIQDLGDVNALGRLITSDGRPTPEAIDRIRNAVFFEAYQSPELSELFSLETDPGIRRILNGMAVIAPRLIELREQAQQLDFSQMLVEAANRIRQARLNPEEGADFANQTSFLDNPAASTFVEFLDEYANSAAAIARTLNPLIDWAENAAKAADGGLFGDEAVVNFDMVDVAAQLRRIINGQRAEVGLDPLPEIDVEAVRAQFDNILGVAGKTIDEVNAQIETQANQAADNLAAAQEAQAAVKQQSLDVLNDGTGLEARARFINEQNPDAQYRVLDDNGLEYQGTLNELIARADEEIAQAKNDAAGIGRGVECILRNEGI